MIESKRWKKTSYEKEAKVIEEKINNNSSASDIAIKLWMSERTVSRIIKENLAKIGEKSVLVANLIDRNNDLQSMADIMISELICNKDEKITIAQLTALRESAFKQNRLMEWESTENHNILWDVLQEIQWMKDNKL